MEILERIYLNLKRQVSPYLPASVQHSVDLVHKSVGNIRLPPLNKENVLYFYMPVQGLVSYTTLSITVMNPHLMVRLFPRRDITDVLFLSAGGGAGLWLWARPHMAAAAPARRFSWAFLGGTLWPLGSIFLWAILRSSVGQKPLIGTVLGITTGAMLTNIAMDYFRYVELMFCGEIHLPDEPYSPNSDDEKYDIDV
ncbi:hypothetical protein JYU34_016380 [Plutella xylostella]|uniref:Uncharacterized protein n=1 Tax=Plutella xylostella TaxID=51655 RepID=A0ABQ7Q2G9_PLUXY|nr:uncharacterized protein LOC105398761 [Plutella xylostella]KAG7299427.1 hypothetical protein JYU34_016380 [Plutella xylostella]